MSFWQLFLRTYVEKKLPKQYWYEKRAQKKLMKLTPGVGCGGGWLGHAYRDAMS